MPLYLLIISTEKNKAVTPSHPQSSRDELLMIHFDLCSSFQICDVCVAEFPLDCKIIYVFAFLFLPDVVLCIITLSQVMNVLWKSIKCS